MGHILAPLLKVMLVFFFVKNFFLGDAFASVVWLYFIFKFMTPPAFAPIPVARVDVNGNCDCLAHRLFGRKRIAA